jgi:hypothetical protein
MTYKEFEKVILAIQEQFNQDCKFGEALEPFFDDASLVTYKNKLITVCCDMLKNIFNDKDDWISWWMWEKDFGTKSLDAKEADGTPIKLDSIKDLYNFLIYNK